MPRKSGARWHSDTGYSPGDPSIDLAPIPPGDWNDRTLLLAKRLGVKRDTFIGWRNGGLTKPLPTYKTAHRIAPLLEKEFDVPAEAWLQGIDVSRQSRLAPLREAEHGTKGGYKRHQRIRCGEWSMPACVHCTEAMRIWASENRRSATIAERGESAVTDLIKARLTECRQQIKEARARERLYEALEAALSDLPHSELADILRKLSGDIITEG